MKRIKPTKLFNILKEFLKNYYFQIILVVIWGIVCFTNYSPNTFLTGWDNIHYEFNYQSNLDKLLTPAWAEYQGLGAPSAHSHASELPRIFLTMLIDVFFETEQVRYVFIFLAHIIGVLGVFHLIKRFILPDKRFGELSAFAAALFYMLNVGTVQHFVVPFEMFVVQYALLPWVIYFTFNVFTQKNWLRNLLALSITLLFLAPSAYASMLWIAFVLGYCAFLFLYNILVLKRQILIKSVSIFLSLVLVNLFWLVPTVHYALNHSSYVPGAKTNIIFSEEAFLTNQKYGNLGDALSNKGFLFDWNIRNSNGQFEPVMTDWVEHTTNEIYIIATIVILGIILSGIVLSLLSRNKKAIALSSFFIIGLVVILGYSSPFGTLLRDFLSDNSVIQEALRFPFTKFSIIFIFGQAIFFSVGINYYLRLFLGWSNLRNKSIILSLIIVTFFCIYSLPIFLGGFVNKSLRIDIPDEYFKVFEYFGTQDRNTRIANLPVNTPFGWFYTDWGYQGSGFMWYGLGQAMLDRDFDRWYTYNEDYYDEMSEAIYTESQEKIVEVLEKYKINWILIDEHVVTSKDTLNVYLDDELASSEMAYDETKELLSEIEGMSLEQKYGKISIYKYNLKAQQKSYIELKEENLRSSDRETFKRNAFNTGNLIRKDSLNKVYEQEDGTTIIENKIVATNAVSNILNIPQIYEKETNILAEIYSRRRGNKLEIKVQYSIPKIYLDGQTVLDPNKSSEISFEVDSKDLAFFLEVNKDIVSINSITADYRLAGSVTISLTQENKFSLFSKQKVLTYTTKELLSKYTAINCSGEELMDSSEIKATVDRVELISDIENICFRKNIAPIKGSNLYELQFKYSSNQNIQPDVCLQFTDTCSTFKTLSTDYFSGLIKESKLYTVNTTSAEAMLLTFVLNSNTASSKSDIKYIRPILRSYEFVDSHIITLNELIEDIKFTPSEVSFRIRPTNDVFNFKMELSNSNKVYTLDSNYLMTNYGLKSFNCSKDADNTVLKRSLNAKTGAYDFLSTNGQNCQNINLYNVNLGLTYLISVEGNNYTGTGLILNVSDFYYKRVFDTTRLPQTEHFKEYLFLPSYVNSHRNGFNLYFNSQSIGDIPTHNGIKEINMISYPYKWMEDILIEDSVFSTINIDDFEVQKKDTGSYLVKISSDSKNDKILVLNQSFEENWKAYDQNGKELTRYGIISKNTDKKYIDWRNYWEVPVGTKFVSIQYVIQTYQSNAVLVSLGYIFLLGLSVTVNKLFLYKK